jgi:hypothetical protein
MRVTVSKASAPHWCTVAGAPAQQGFHARFQFGQLERLGHVIVGAQVQALHALFQPAARCQDQHRCFGARAAPRAQAAQHVQPVHAGQGQVQDDERVVLGVEEGVGIGPGGGAFDRQVGVAQRPGQPVRQFDVVFD